MDERKMKELTLMVIVKVVDGDQLESQCVLGLKECSGKNPCPIHEKYAPVRADLIHLLTSATIYQLANGLGTGFTSLKR